MLPSFIEGDIVLFIAKKTYKVGDVVIAEISDREVIKRITTIDDQTVYLLGDNTQQSTDSRKYGAVNLGLVKGKCVQKLSFGWFTAKRS